MSDDDSAPEIARHFARLVLSLQRPDGAAVALDDAKVVVERFQLALRLHFHGYAALTAVLQATADHRYRAHFPFVPYTTSDVLESGREMPHEMENLVDLVRRMRAQASLADDGTGAKAGGAAPPPMPVDIEPISARIDRTGFRVVAVLDDDGVWYHKDDVHLVAGDDHSGWWRKVPAPVEYRLDDDSLVVRPCDLLWERFVVHGHRLRLLAGAFCHDYSTAVPSVDVATLPLRPELLQICAIPDARLSYVDTHLVVAGGNGEFVVLRRVETRVLVNHYRDGDFTPMSRVEWSSEWWPRCAWRTEPVAAADRPLSSHLFALPLASLLYRAGLAVELDYDARPRGQLNPPRLTDADEIDRVFTLATLTDALLRMSRLSALSDEERDQLASPPAVSEQRVYSWNDGAGGGKPRMDEIFRRQLAELLRLLFDEAERSLTVCVASAPPGFGKTYAIVKLLLDLVRQHSGARPFLLLFAFSLCNVGSKLLGDIERALEQAGLSRHVVLSHYDTESVEQWTERCVRPANDVRVLARFTTISSLLPQRRYRHTALSYDGIVIDECEAALRFMSTAPILKRRDETRDALVALCAAPSVRLVQLLDRDAGLSTRLFAAEIAHHSVKRARHHNLPLRRITCRELRLTVRYARTFITLPAGDEMFAAAMLYELVVRRRRNVLVSVSSKRGAKALNDAFRCVADMHDRDDDDRARSRRVVLVHGDSDKRVRDKLARDANAFVAKHQPSLLIYTGTLGRGTSFDAVEPPHFHDVVLLVYPHVGDDDDKQAIDRARMTLSQLEGGSRIVYVMPCERRTKPRYPLVRRVGLSSTLGAMWHAINDELASRYAQDQSAAALLGGGGRGGRALDSTVCFDLATDTRPHLNAARPATFLTAIMIGLQRLALELKSEVYLQDIVDTGTEVRALKDADRELFDRATAMRLDRGEMALQSLYNEIVEAPLSREARETAMGGAASETSADHHKVLALKTFGWWNCEEPDADVSAHPQPARAARSLCTSSAVGDGRRRRGKDVRGRQGARRAGLPPAPLWHRRRRAAAAAEATVVSGALDRAGVRVALLGNVRPARRRRASRVGVSAADGHCGFSRRRLGESRGRQGGQVSSSVQEDQLSLARHRGARPVATRRDD